MRFRSGLLFDLRRRYPADAVAAWQARSEEFFAHLERADLVQLVVTDRFETVVSQWGRDTPHEFGGEGAVVYRAGKSDGTRAGAKTVVLAEHRCAVVVGVDAIALDDDTLRWMLTHEVQHALLHQQDASAVAVQRRLGREVDPPRPWAFILPAQASIDEFRCERAVYAQRGAREPTYDPADATRLLGQLRTARAASRAGMDRSYEIVVRVLDRLATMAAYVGAAVEAGADQERRWAGLPELALLWDRLHPTPHIGEPVEPEDLWRHAVELSEELDLVLRGYGVEHVFEDDGISLYFR